MGFGGEATGECLADQRARDAELNAQSRGRPGPSPEQGVPECVFFRGLTLLAPWI